jgi:hypothetical protein
MANNCRRVQAGMIPQVMAVEQIRRMRGGAQSHLMRCSDGHYYIVKFQNNPQHRRILVNELLGTRLAARLDLPVAPVAIVHVSEDLIHLTPDLCMEMPRSRVPCKAGLQFGSRFPGNPRCPAHYDFLADQQLCHVDNLRDFAGMLVFDKWTCNTDGRQVVFKRKETKYTATMIDQGFCFNCGEWNFPDAPLRGRYCRTVVYDSIRGIDDFEPWLSKLETQIDESTIWECAANIPPEWYDSQSDVLARLADALNRRRARVRELLWSIRGCKDFLGMWVHSAAAAD